MLATDRANPEEIISRGGVLPLIAMLSAAENTTGGKKDAAAGVARLAADEPSRQVPEPSLGLP